MLLTGDIEEIAEQQIIQEYQNSNQLKANLLKIAHHGSKSSTTQEFLEQVKPKIALIGVGAKNTFGHPNEGIIERLNQQKCKIYRTDLMGEITIRVNTKGKIWINKMLH